MARTKLDVKVIEVEKQFVLPALDQGSAAAVAMLAGHPGFQYLVAALHNQAAVMKAALIKNRHKDMRDVEFLQSGINWAGWLAEFVTKAAEMAKPKEEPREMRDSERMNFEVLRNQIDVVGVLQAGDNA